MATTSYYYTTGLPYDGLTISKTDTLILFVYIVVKILLMLIPLQRGFTLFLLGVMLNTVGVGPELSSLRVFGILQRFGIVYIIVSSLVIFLTHRPSTNNKPVSPAL